jgi:uncharacterized protein (DUF433 family)
MSLILEADPVPLSAGADGVIRVGGSRVTLDTIVEKFDQGATAEELGLKFPTLKLAHIYAVIAFYLEHRAEVASYLQEQDQAAAQIRQENTARFNLVGIRERLLARQAAQDAQS